MSTANPWNPPAQPSLTNADLALAERLGRHAAPMAFASRKLHARLLKLVEFARGNPKKASLYLAYGTALPTKFKGLATLPRRAAIKLGLRVGQLQNTTWLARDLLFRFNTATQKQIEAIVRKKGIGDDESRIGLFARCNFDDILQPDRFYNMSSKSD